MDLRHLPPSPSPGLVNLLIEIPAGSRNKLEYCAQSGLIVMDLDLARISALPI